jgi:hypothetical protein
MIKSVIGEMGYSFVCCTVESELHLYSRRKVMLNLVSKMIHYVERLSKQFLSQFLPVFLMGVLLLSNMANGIDANGSMSKDNLSKRVDKDIHQDAEKRPKTTGEWNKQSRETQGKPGERLKRVGEQSAEAIKDFGSVFPDTAERSAAELENGIKTSN